MKRSRVLYLLGGFSLLLLTAPRLDAERYRLEYLGVEDGLSHSSVWDLHQDRRGFLWIATETYLHRYDGYELRDYKHDPDDPDSLSASEVMAIYEDRGGTLWFGTRAAGLNRFDPETESFTRFRHDPDDPDSLLPGLLFPILQDRDGFLWVGTPEGLSRLDEATGSFTRFRHAPDDPDSLAGNFINALLEDRAGRLWVATDRGLDRHDRERGSFEHVLVTDDGSDTPAPWSLHEDTRGRLWLGGADGALRLLREDGSLELFRPERAAEDPPGNAGILQIAEGAGALWLATNGHGLLRFDPESGTFLAIRHDPDDPQSLRSDDLRTLHFDRSGTLWITTRDGVSKLDFRWQPFAILRRARDPVVTGVSEDHSGRLWIGTEKGALLGLAPAEAEAVAGPLGRELIFQRSPGDGDGLPEGSVEVVLESRAGDVWVGLNGGLARLDLQERRFYPEAALDGEAVYDLHEDAAGNIWAAAEGLFRLTAGQEPAQYTHDPEKPGSSGANKVYDLEPDLQGRLWLATEAGLSRFDPDTKTFERIHQDSEAPVIPETDDLTVLYQEPAAETLWVGTYGNGLVRWDLEGQHWRRYREKDGLANDKVVDIVPSDDGVLWISTNRGLSRFDPATETFRTYDSSNGLHGDLFYIGAGVRTVRGEIVLGGYGGVTAFRPAELREDPVAPAVVLTRLRLGDEVARPAHRQAGSPLQRSITATGELTLDHRDKTFSLEFAGLHFTNPQRNRYSYRLEGYDSDWVTADASQRVARYTNLDPGGYTFRVKAANPDGVWTEGGESLRIRVEPPPWKTWWAYATYVLALAGSLASYSYLQQQKVRRERQVAEREREANRRLQAIDRLKDEFLANTSHELRTPLHGMTGLAEALLDGVHGNVTGGMRDDLSMVVSCGRRLGHLINDILDFSKLRHKNLELSCRPVDLHSIVEVVLTLSRSLAGSKPVELVNAVPDSLALAYSDENRLQQILHNLVGNALKFTEAGRVEVSAELDSDRIVIRVMDTGIGIPEERQERIFEAFEQADASTEREYGGTGLGLAVSRQLVELHGGTLRVRSRPGAGSTFTFDLPVAESPVAPRPARPEEAPDPAVVSPAESVAAAAARESGVVAGVALPDAPIAGFEGARILVVDDEPVNRQVLRNYLSVENYELTVASSGEEALRLLEERSFDLVLLDVMMPRLSGYEVCRKLREARPLDELPVIFLTAKDQPSDVVAGLSLGANDYLTKPVSRGELLARVRPHLDLLQINRNLENLVREKVSQLKVLAGLLPICAACKKIRDDAGYWSEVEVFIDSRSEASFSHGLCPGCADDYLKDFDGEEAGGS